MSDIIKLMKIVYVRHLLKTKRKDLYNLGVCNIDRCWLQ